MEQPPKVCGAARFHGCGNHAGFRDGRHIDSSSRREVGGGRIGSGGRPPPLVLLRDRPDVRDRRAEFDFHFSWAACSRNWNFEMPRRIGKARFFKLWNRNSRHRSGTIWACGTTFCRNGSCTSKECSWAWARGLTSMSGRLASASRSTTLSPSGVRSRLTPGDARP